MDSDQSAAPNYFSAFLRLRPILQNEDYKEEATEVHENV